MPKAEIQISMSNWNPTAQYYKVAEANRQYYEKTAQMYDKTETCVTDEQPQQMLEHDLDRILTLIGRPAHEIKALDACGGSGNVALKLLKRGVNVTLADISEQQINIFKQKCQQQGFVANLLCGEIGQCFSQKRTAYELIIFSSALHHLEDISSILALAYEHLVPGGLLFTVFDPTAKANHKAITKNVLWLDYFAFKLMSQTADLPFAVQRRLRRILAGYHQHDNAGKQVLDLTNETLGVLAEYHVEQGINDFELVVNSKQIGYQVIWHDRYSGGRYAITRWIVQQVHDATQFKLLLRKPTEVDL